jgi:hypothetical protein
MGKLRGSRGYAFSLRDRDAGPPIRYGLLFAAGIPSSGCEEG